MPRTIQVAPTEAQIQKAILDLLAAERILAIRFNSGMLRNSNGRPVRMHSAGAGMADIQAFPRISICLFCKRTMPQCEAWEDSAERRFTVGAVLWIEVKRPGKVPSLDQLHFSYEIGKELNHYYLVAHSVDDVSNWLRLFGGKGK